jgi:insecticidal toxin complex protein TccC
LSANIHRHTPVLAATDARGLAVRQVAYLRAVESDHPAARISTAQNDAAGRLVAQRDPRFSSTATQPNQAALYSLSGAALLTDSVDAGWRLSLTGDAGQVLEQWDGRGSHWQNEYDELRRPVALHEYALGMDLRTVERLTYADNSAEFAERNQCGSLIRHDDSAGTLWLRQVALNGGLIRQTRRFLPDRADLSANWPATEADRDALLQPGTGYTSQHRYGPSGEVLEQKDASGHLRQFNFDRAGQLQRIDLTLKDRASLPLLIAADYDAAGRLLAQIAGNNVTSVASYQPANGRLEHLTATASTRQRLQEMSYEYDPVGNILRLVDHTQADSYFDNQRVAAQNTYNYDSLYQLTSAKGRETAGAGQTPELPELNIPSPIDPARLLNYTEYYEYDTGGNRTLLRHESDKNPFSRRMYVDPQSNRALPWSEGEGAPDFSHHFDSNGNLQYLASGAQPMTWDARNQLQGVINVQRPTGINDGEWYRYNAAGERVVKFSTRQARNVIHQDIVHYLPGLEVRTADVREELQVIDVQLAHGSVRCLHWIKGPPDGIDNDQVRYSIDDHLGSSCLELDQQAAVISHEGYYPYGGTAWWAARSQVDADYKTIRYSGKERDATGLLYYGLRYLAPWLGRWINPDPLGVVDGLNVYRMVGNNPINFIDVQGGMMQPAHIVVGIGGSMSTTPPSVPSAAPPATMTPDLSFHQLAQTSKPPPMPPVESQTWGEWGKNAVLTAVNSKVGLALLPVSTSSPANAAVVGAILTASTQLLIQATLFNPGWSHAGTWDPAGDGSMPPTDVTQAANRAFSMINTGTTLAGTVGGLVLGPLVGGYVDELRGTKLKAANTAKAGELSTNINRLIAEQRLLDNVSKYAQRSLREQVLEVESLVGITWNTMEMLEKIQNLETEPYLPSPPTSPVGTIPDVYSPTGDSGDIPALNLAILRKRTSSISQTQL